MYLFLDQTTHPGRSKTLCNSFPSLLGKSWEQALSGLDFLSVAFT